MLVKKYVKSRNVCKVAFLVPEEELPEGVEIESIAVVGEFNRWVGDAAPMSRRRGGLYRADVELEPGKEYQFRYSLNGEEWYNDWYADARPRRHGGRKLRRINTNSLTDSAKRL